MFSTITQLAHDDRWHPAFPLIPLLFLAFWIVVFTIFVRRWRNPQRSAEAVLWERYARGEIEKEEFEAKRKDLS